MEQWVGPKADEDLNSTFTQEDLEEIDSLNDGVVLKRRNVETGVFLKDYNTDEDVNKLSFLYHINSDPTAPTDIQSLEAIYAYRLKNIWVELFGFQTTGKFKDLTANSGYEGGTSEDLINSDDTVTAFGVSLAYRDNWISNLLGTEKVFTTTSAGIGWYSYNQTLRELTYSGPGLKADFGIHRRSSKTFHYGVKMSYHLASTKRASEEEGESSASRAHTLSWLTFGLDISFYF